MRSGGSSSQRRSSERIRYSEGNAQPGSNNRRSGASATGEALSGVTEGARTYANKAYEYASDVTDKVTEKTSAYTSAATEYADDLRRSTIERSEQLMQGAQSTMQTTMSRVLREQPLTVALVGLAAGAAVAAAFPTTDIETRTLGPMGERISDAVTQTGEKLKEAASEAGEKLKSVADERGLNKDGLKEVARDVAGTFGSTFSGGEHDKGAQNAPRPAERSSISPGAGAYSPSSSGPGGSSGGGETPSSAASRPTPFPSGTRQS
jgi:hypothetical protein